MGTKVIDIDTLLEATLDLTTENSAFMMKQVEIDKLLDNTQDW
ncbi:hypothetical protein [Neobacillus kokaensis]|uniref:Uncharacterized protein n=1 Tax=Neobacillus kokaensis TaxID=2759023 RepID=A0ABQ3N9J3_9BACI|nr:hypothetical protein [Neobacillus kokaensis]GHI00912.1 hypothetical protein AM1BK_44540 [Neobacillus kokaensis]